MPPTFNQRTSVITAVIVVFVLAGSSYAAYQIGYRNGAGTKGLSQTQNTQLAPTEVRLVLGTVEKISGQEITLKDTKKIPDSTANSASQSGSIVVTVDQSAIIERLVQKDITIINKEIATFTEATKQAPGTQSSTTPSTPPEPFTRVKITLNDIKVGDVLVVSSAKDISKLTAFTATRVEMQGIPKLPAPPTATSTTVKVDATQRPAPPLPPEALKAQGIPKLPAPSTTPPTATSTTVKVDATQRPAPPPPPGALKAQ